MEKVFLQFSSSPYFLLSCTTLLSNLCRPASDSEISAVLMNTCMKKDFLYPRKQSNG